MDDIRGLTPKTKLAAQILATAAWACWEGVRITAINDQPVASWWAIPLTVFWLIACTNAINLIDGLDGLASEFGVVCHFSGAISGYRPGEHRIDLGHRAARRLLDCLSALQF